MSSFYTTVVYVHVSKNIFVFCANFFWTVLLFLLNCVHSALRMVAKRSFHQRPPWSTTWNTTTTSAETSRQNLKLILWQPWFWRMTSLSRRGLPFLESFLVLMLDAQNLTTFGPTWYTVFFIMGPCYVNVLQLLMFDRRLYNLWTCHYTTVNISYRNSPICT
jgi:hypothetical protein